MLKKGVKIDIKQWIITFFNTFGGGSGLTAQQAINRRKELTRRFEAFKHKHSLSTSKCGGSNGLNALERAWLRDTAGDDIYTDFPFYAAAGTLINRLTEAKRLDEFLTFCNTYVDNRARGQTSVSEIIRNISAVEKNLRTSYKQNTTMSDERYWNLWWEAVKCCVPLRDDEPQFADCLWIFKDHCDATEKVIDRLSVLMPEGKHVLLKINRSKKKAEKKRAKAKKAAATAALKKTKKENASANIADKSGGKKVKKPTKAQKAAAKAAAMAAAEAEAAAVAEAEAAVDVQQDGDATSESDVELDLRTRVGCRFFDDVSGCLTTSSTSLTSRRYRLEKQLTDLERQCLRAAVHLLWTRSCIFQSKTFDRWPNLKKTVASAVSKACSIEARRIREASENERCTLAQSVHSIAITEFMAFVASAERQQTLKLQHPYMQFSASVNAPLSAAMRSSSSETETSVKSLDDMQLCDIVDAIINEVELVYPSAWGFLMSDVLDGKATDLVSRYGDELAAIFPTATQADGNTFTFDSGRILNIVMVRSRYIYHCLKDVTAHSCHEVTKDFIQVEEFSDHLGAAETACRTKDACVSFWAGLWPRLSWATAYKSAVQSVDMAKAEALGQEYTAPADAAEAAPSAAMTDDSLATYHPRRPSHKHSHSTLPGLFSGRCMSVHRRLRLRHLPALMQLMVHPGLTRSPVMKTSIAWWTLQRRIGCVHSTNLSILSRPAKPLPGTPSSRMLNGATPWLPNSTRSRIRNRPFLIHT